MSLRPKASPAAPSLGLALGGGGARGLAHIVVLEALDEVGMRPAVIAGTSMGAVIGAAYAAGMAGRELRAFVLGAIRDRADVFAKLLGARVGRLVNLVRGLNNPVLVDGEKFLDLFWPEAVPDRFEDLATPLLVIATDYYAHGEVVFTQGPLVTAVAGSMAMPGFVRPVAAGGRVLIDGGAVNPLPFEHLIGRVGVVAGVDATGGPHAGSGQPPEPFEALFGASQIMQNALVAEKLKARRPDILLRPAVEGFRALDFFKAKAIFSAAEPVKDEFKRALDLALAGTVPQRRARKKP